jgi:hypothetical protein
MSLAETQQVYNLLIEIKAILDGIDVKQEKIAKDLPKLQESLGTARQFERMMIRVLVLCGTGNMNDATKLLIHALMIARTLQTSFSILMAPTNPLGLITGLIGLTTGLYNFGFGLYDSLQGYQ